MVTVQGFGRREFGIAIRFLVSVFLLFGIRVQRLAVYMEVILEF